jgi:translation initiation factor IF-2
MASEKEARQLATEREQLLREQRIRTTDQRMSLDKIAQRTQDGETKDLNLIIKGDVGGSVEALADALVKLSNEEVTVNIVMKGVGQISESDVLLASASDALIIGFQVRPSVSANKLIKEEQIDLRLYSVIYDAINEIKDAIEGMLTPDIQEKILGTAEVREVFKITKVGTVAGCRVVDGKIHRNNPVRLIRDGYVTYTGHLDSLKRFKDDVKEVVEGFECGMSITNYNDIKEGDLIESFETVEVKRTLS